ncbi:Pyrroline-5-carboxylate reductase [termite gut metagenome]|uniref:Pyrroline-5-carboxylate reductase n=1 Tax=termite gut metagenome TaxID=433724 RepID=A0A5J4S3Y1_9ZZZZ
MKIAIIGAGNMGGAIARGLTQGTRIKVENITVSDPNNETLEMLKASSPSIQTTHNNQEAVNNAEMVIIAVKPWLVREVMLQLTFNFNKQIIASVAAGIPFSDYLRWFGEAQYDNKSTIFRIVPNMAISQLSSMTLLASRNATKEQEAFVLDLFNEMGQVLLIPEEQIPATTALSSCGIAYVLKYIQAAMQAGIEMGIYPKDAMKIVAQSVKGAAELILNNDTHPSIEIDKITTPGGITIKGINELEQAGFGAAIIRAMKISGQ